MGGANSELMLTLVSSIGCSQVQEPRAYSVQVPDEAIPGVLGNMTTDAACRGKPVVRLSPDCSGADL